MRRAAVFLIGLLSACVAKEDANPALSSLELSKLGPVMPNDRIGIRVVGEELWGRPLALEIHFVPESGPDRVVRTLSLEFDQMANTQTASTTWRLDPTLLRDQGMVEIYFRASAEGVELESERLYVEVQPVLLDISLVAPPPLGAGSDVTAFVTGKDVWGRGLDVTVLRNDQPIQSLDAVFDETLEEQTASATWRIAGDFLDRPGRNELRFRAELGDQSVESEVLILDVVSEISALSLFREGENGRFPLQAGGAVPVVEELVLVAQGTALAGLTSTITVYRTPNIVLAEEYVPAGNMFELSFRPEEADLGGEETIGVFFRVAVGGVEADSVTVNVERSGFFSCDWQLSNGQLLAGDTVVDDGTSVVMRASTWGLANLSGAFEIWEADSTSGDDFVARLNTTADMSSAQADWTAVYTEDGTLQTEAEYYFIADIGGRTCRSPQLIVRD